MDDLLKLQEMLTELVDEANEELGSEKVAPYICILDGVLKGINADLNSN